MANNPSRSVSDSGETAGNDWSHPWAYLVWLGFLALPLVKDRPQDWWATAAAVAAFLAVYFWGFRRSGWTLWLSRAATFAVGVALFPYNAFAHTFFIYAGIPGARAKATESIVIMTLIIAASYAYFVWQNLGGIYFGLVSVMVLGLGTTVLAARAKRFAQAALAGKDVEIARLAKAAERERIARDLHDLLGHTLSVIAIKAELAHKIAGQDAARASGEMQEVASVARKALSKVRETIVGLRTMDVPEALRAVESMLSAAGITVTQQAAPMPDLSEAQTHALAQVILEAGTNIVRHAEAHRVLIHLHCTPSALTVEINDDGRGGPIHPGNGITGMQERMRSVRGDLYMTELNPGFRLAAVLPLAEPSATAL